MRSCLALACVLILAACTGPGTPRSASVEPKPVEAPTSGLSITGEARIGIVTGG